MEKETRKTKQCLASIGKNVLCYDIAHLFAEGLARKVPCTVQLRQ